MNTPLISRLTLSSDYFNGFHVFCLIVACSGFLCDKKRCIPPDWKCDGHVDCQDQSDESECDACGPGAIYCGEKRCMSQKNVCDGLIDCPYGQDERNCSKYLELNFVFFLNFKQKMF